MKKVFFGVYLDIFIQEKNDIRLTDLKQYEHDLNTKGITYPVKLKDISKFETQNPTIPGINVFSVNENNILLEWPNETPKIQLTCSFTKRMENAIIHSLKTFQDSSDLK